VAYRLQPQWGSLKGRLLFSLRTFCLLILTLAFFSSGVVRAEDGDDAEVPFRPLTPPPEKSLLERMMELAVQPEVGPDPVAPRPPKPVPPKPKPEVVVEPVVPPAAPVEIRTDPEMTDPEVPFRPSRKTAPEEVGEYKQMALDAANATGEYLYRGFTTGGVGFFVRRPEYDELRALEQKRWTESWYQKEGPFRYHKIPEYLWPYQWPVRAATKLATGDQILFTPGKGIGNVVDRMTCSRVAKAVVGQFVLTAPAKFVLTITPTIVGAVYLGKGLNWGQAKYLEYRIQGPLAEFLDGEIANNMLLKPQRSALKAKKLSREEARRQAHQLLKESENYFSRVAEVWPKEVGGDEELAFILWSLNLQSFNDLKDLNLSREITVDESRYLYPEGFFPVASDQQMTELVFNRHSTLFKMRGAETLINDITKKSADLKVDAAGRNVLEAPIVQKILDRFKAGELDETSARKWIHVYLDWEQEINQTNILGFYKRARENGEFTDRPLELADIARDIEVAMDAEAFKKAGPPSKD